MLRTKSTPTIFVVEGISDQKLMARFVDAKLCTLLCAHGRVNVEEAIAVLHRESVAGCLGLVDADFDRVNGVARSADNIVCYEHADSEMMLLMSPALDRVLVEYAVKSKVDSLLRCTQTDSVRDCLLRCGEPLAQVRHASLVCGLKLKFKGIDYGKFVCAKTLRVDEKKAIQLVVANTKQADLTPEAVSQLLEQRPSDVALSEYCCGHDCTTILSIGLRQAIANLPQQLASKANVERLLRLAFEWADLMRSTLYEQIVTWENRNPAWHVLQSSPAATAA